MTPKRLALHAVILAGGSGTRLWPLSTQRCPKQFLAMGEAPSLIQQTVFRVHELIPLSQVWVVCGQSHFSAVTSHLPNVPPQHLLIEPQAKNTAAAIALAAIHLRAQDPEALMAVLPADHLLLEKDGKVFCGDLQWAAELARERKGLVTLGIPPTEPSTGYGYIEPGEKFEQEGRAYFQVRQFHEKPDLKTAQGYLAKGGFYWNSGMFVWGAKTFLEELGKAQASTGEIFEDLSHHLGEKDFPEKVRQVFQGLEDISVDYAVMEKSKKVFVVPARFGWDDVGSLTSFEKTLAPDPSDNRIQGEVFVVESGRNLVIAQSRAVALIGVHDLIVVETPEAVLVLPKGKAQDVKKMVEELKRQKREELL